MKSTEDTRRKSSSHSRPDAAAPDTALQEAANPPSDLASAPTPLASPAPEFETESPVLEQGRSIHLSERAWRKLGPHLEGQGWAPESLLEQVILDTLHGAYPEITYRGVCIAKAGVYRGFDRATQRPAMRMASSCGEFVVNTRTHNEEYVKWLAVYQSRGDAAPESKAAEMCLFSLERELQRPGSDKRIIYPDDFLVETRA